MAGLDPKLCGISGLASILSPSREAPRGIAGSKVHRDWDLVNQIGRESGFSRNLGGKSG